MRISDNISYYDAGKNGKSRADKPVQSETDKRKTLLFLTEKAHALKGEYDSVSDEMGSIYYMGFSEEEITRFEECLDRIRKNLEEWQKS